jgi:hypothetical protein
MRKEAPLQEEAGGTPAAPLGAGSAARRQQREAPAAPPGASSARRQQREAPAARGASSARWKTWSRAREGERRIRPSAGRKVQGVRGEITPLPTPHEREERGPPHPQVDTTRTRTCVSERATAQRLQSSARWGSLSHADVVLVGCVESHTFFAHRGTREAQGGGGDGGGRGPAPPF